MARSLPRPLARRELLYSSDTPREVLVGLAEAYLAQGLAFDAVDFYVRAKDRAGLEKMRGVAVDAGDAFILRKVHEAAPDLVSAADWQALGEHAKQLGKETYAERAANGGTPPPPPLQEETRISGETPPQGDAATE